MIKGHLHKGKEKINFEIPSQWSEITISDLELFSSDSDYLEIFSKMANLSIDLVKNCRAEEVAFIVNELGDLFNFNELTELKEHYDSVILEGRTFNVTTDLFNMPAGQWWDIKKVEQMYHDKPIKALVNMLAMLLIEEGKQYNYSDVEEKVKMIEQMDVETAFKLRGFFLANQIIYLADLKLSSQKATIRKKFWRDMMNLAESTGVYLQSLILHKINLLSVRFLGKKKK